MYETVNIAGLKYKQPWLTRIRVQFIEWRIARCSQKVFRLIDKANKLEGKH